MDRRDEDLSTRNLISLVLCTCAIMSLTCSTKLAHREIDELFSSGGRAHQRINELEEYINDVELQRSQDRAELDSFKEDMLGPRESESAIKP